MRTERMKEAAKAAARLGLANITFQQSDLRTINRKKLGDFDVIFFLGILYHLEVPTSFEALERLHEMCGSILIVDTLIASEPNTAASHGAETYEGYWVREHEDNASLEEQQRQILMSYGNARSFFFTRASLAKLLHDIGFTSVFECLGPLEPGISSDRITLVAVKGFGRVKLSTYPWVNESTERKLANLVEWPAIPDGGAARGASGSGDSSNRFSTGSVMN